tara:strand:+ start:170 stop:784 length:615 start_codon:yes stop_codon:yes gene_type:complete
MMELMRAGGLLMIPIVICSVLITAIVIERLWTLDAKKVSPKNLVPQIWVWLKNDQLNSTKLKQLRESSPLGVILAAGLSSQKSGKDAMIESTETAASIVIHEMEYNIGTLGIVASICPLLGLLGTVTGMIQVFGETISSSPATLSLATGISSALITTAAGLIVAIPAYIFHRYFTRKIEVLILNLEQETSKLITSIYTSETQKI